MSKFKIYFRSSSTALLSTFVSKASAFLSVWLLNQVLEKQSYGDYEFAFSLSSILLILGSAGLQHVVMYRLSRIDAPPEKLAGSELVGRLFRYSLVSSGLVCVLIILVTPLILDGNKSFWIVGLAFLIPIKALHGIYDAWYRARQRIAESIVYYEMFPAIAKVFFLLLTWFLWADVYVVIIAIILSELVPLLVRYFKEPVNIFENSKKSLLITWDFKYAGQLAVTTGLSKTVKDADIIMMGLLSSSLATAEYVIASKVSLILTIAHGINNKIITPRIGSFLGKGDFQSISLEYHKSRILTLTFSFLGSIFFVLFGYYILNLFGEYSDSYSTLMILCATYVIHVSFGMSGGYLNIAGYSNLTLFVTMMMLLLNVSLNYLLIPILEADGAALAMLISFIVANIVTSILVLQKDHLAVYSLKLALFVCTFVIALLLNAFSIISIATCILILMIILGLFLYDERKFLNNFIINLQKQLRGI